ncbi:MAG: tRNA 2-thiouridine(34) synthase MnmA [Bacteriovoracaceae bacterium]|nr:tRNA 2-thiouridine(34) synthase MnmA [Bacteriovoracaceae bacterium]
MNGKTVVCGMSGGVDSSVAALLLKKEGYKVIGVFMKNWEELDENGTCTATKDYEDAVAVCEKIGIPYYAVEFIKEYRENVFNQFLEEYKQGHTPNPDVLCNREIKFKVFFEKALELGADYIATGHYCQNPVIDGVTQLAKGLDPNKDQSYFLCAVRSKVLEKVLFPIGHLPKPEVRKIAEEYDLITKDKKDSTGICFIGERNFRDFLSKYIQTKDGDFESLDGKVIGTHMGSAYYTLGQRKGLGLGGPGEPWFVVGKDIERNVVVVERGLNHPALFCDELTATDISWVTDVAPSDLPKTLNCKVRYRQADQKCTLVKIEGDRLFVEFDTPQRSVTPRQSIVFYEGDICLGGAMIETPGPSYYKMSKPVPEK